MNAAKSVIAVMKFPMDAQKDDFITSINQKKSWKEACSRSTGLLQCEDDIDKNVRNLTNRPLYTQCNLCNTVLLSETFRLHVDEKHSDKIKQNELLSSKYIPATKLDESLILLNQTNDNNHEAAIINTEFPIEEKMKSPIINPKISLEEKIKSIVINTKIPVGATNESSETNGLSQFKKMLDANTKFWNEHGDQLSKKTNHILKAIDEKQFTKEKYGSLVEEFAKTENYKSSGRQILDRAEKLELLQRKEPIQQQKELHNKLIPLKFKSFADKYHDNDKYIREKLRPPCSPFELDNKTYEEAKAFQNSISNEAHGNAKNDLIRRSQPNNIQDLRNTYTLTPIKKSRNSFNIPGPETLVENRQTPIPVIKNIPNNIKNRINSEEKILNTFTNQVEPQQPVKSKNIGIDKSKEISNKRTAIQGTPVSNLPTNLLANPVPSVTNHNLMSSSNYPDLRQPGTNLNMMNNLNPSYHPGITNNAPGKVPIIPPSVPRNFLPTTNVRPDGRSRGSEMPHRMPREPKSSTPRVSSKNIYNNQPTNIYATTDMVPSLRNPTPMQPTRIVNNPSLIQNNLFEPNVQSNQDYNNFLAHQTPPRVLFDPNVYMGPVNPIVQVHPTRNFGQSVQANAQNLRNSNMASYSSMGQPMQMIPSNGTNQLNHTINMARMNQPIGVMQTTGITQPNSIILPSHMTQQEYSNLIYRFMQAEQTQNESQNMINRNNNINPRQGYQMTNNMGSNEIYMGNNNTRLMENSEQGVNITNQPMTYINHQPEPNYQVVIPAGNEVYFSPEMASQNLQNMARYQPNNLNNNGYYADNANTNTYDMINYNNYQPSFNNLQPIPNHQLATYRAMQPNEIQPSQNLPFNNNNMIGVANYQNIAAGNQGQSMSMGFPNVRNTNFSVPNNNPNVMNTYNNGNINNISVRPGQNLPNGNSANMFFQNPNILNINVPTTNTRNAQNIFMRPTGYNPNMHPYNPYNPNNPNMFQGRR